MKRTSGVKPVPIEGTANFDCRVPGGGIDPALGRSNVPQNYSITADTTPDDPKNKGKVLPKFNFSGTVASTNCCFDEPFDGFLMLHESEVKIKSIEI